jgi:curved DNA-binding protein CbpA
MEKEENLLILSGNPTLEEVKREFKAKSKIYHPDAQGGNKDKFQKLVNEYDKSNS